MSPQSRSCPSSNPPGTFTVLHPSGEPSPSIGFHFPVSSIAFFTTAAYDEERGIVSDYDLRQTAIRKIVLKNAAKSVFLFESYKLGKRMLHTLCRKEDATAVLISKGDTQ